MVISYKNSALILKYAKKSAMHIPVVDLYDFTKTHILMLSACV